MTLYESLLRPCLFRMEPERAHALVLGTLEWAARVPGALAMLAAAFRFDSPALRARLGGITLSNPVGLAAGFDKDARAPLALAALGFGFIELGTVTLRPQSGNPSPRLWRIPEEEALLNRLGFNNDGAEALARRLREIGELPLPVGVNIGLNADVPLEKSPWEYAGAFELLREHGNYFVVNVSSPNTDRLRELQGRLRLERILTEIDSRNPRRKPVLVKLSPDMDPERLEELCPLLLQAAAGAVVSNTTLSREGLPERYLEQRGGLSGAPLRLRSTEWIARLRRATRGRLPIVGVGGISSAEHAYEKLRAGASAVQLYTGLVYKGPGLVREIKRGLAGLLEAHGLPAVEDAVGLSVNNA